MYDKQWTRRKANQAPGQNFPRMGIWWESGLGLKTSSKVVKQSLSNKKSLSKQVGYFALKANLL